MKKDAKIFVAGHKGMVGSAIVRALQKSGYNNLLLRSRQELDLTDSIAVERFFADEKPQFVFLSAAKVGGIVANATYPADFIYQNLVIQNNIIHCGWRHEVDRLLFLGSSCIYPKECAQPIKEDYFLSGKLEPTNSAYAVAKIAGVEMCRSFNKQHGTRFLAAMPTNLYGINDNYDLENSHVLPALIRKIHHAHVNNQPSVEIWGTGTPRREFLFSDDLADACCFLMNLDDDQFSALLGADYYPLINIGSGQDLSIGELAYEVSKVIGYQGDFHFNTERPDGTMRKLLDVSKINGLGWTHSTSLSEGIQMAYHDFLNSTR